MLKNLTAFSFAACLLMSPAMAETTLIFATAYPPESKLSIGIHEEWAERVNADGKGVVQIDLRHGFNLAGPTNFYDRVKDGIVPISFGATGLVGGQFPQFELANLPFLTDDPVVTAVAFWRLYEEGLLDSQFEGIVPLYFVTFPNSQLHLREPLPDLDSLHGANVIVSGKTNGHTIELLGGTPVSVSPADAYESIQRGTADGRLLPWSGFMTFKMDEITKYSIEAPFGTAVLMAFISREVWDGLSEEEREILLRHSGEEQTRKATEFTIGYVAEERERALDGTGHQVVSPSAEQMAAWEVTTAPVMERWIQETPNGAQVLERFMKHSTDIAAELAAE